MYVCVIFCEKFLEVDIGIIGCNFVIVDMGFVSFVINEGNGWFVSILLKI